MDILNYLMSSTQAWGGFATFILLIMSFVGVHAVKLSSKGYLLYRQESETVKKEKKTESPPPPVEKPTKQPQVAPVYYLVEKKRARKKPAVEYAEPKRIQFEKEKELSN